jgi:Tol biopolymer transport system component
MDLDGSNVTNVPNTQAAGWAKWSRGPDPFIVLVYPASGTTSAIYHIRPDGSNRFQITTPGPNENDEDVDVVDDKWIVYTRLDRANQFKRDLYIKYIWDSRPPVRLTNTPGESAMQPVISHDGRKIAYRVFFGGGRDDVIQVAGIDTTPRLTPLNRIDLAPPADVNISGIDFSGDDTRLYIATQANDVGGTIINRWQEVWSVKLDGTDQRRLTINNDSDTYPSAVRK